jgi:glycosyltransferase involved in cell wall biosynthesis
VRIAVLYGRFCLSHRGTLPFAGHRADPRGLTGSEYGFIRIAQELAALGHEVTAYTVSDEVSFEGLTVRPVSSVHEIDSGVDLAISINEPELLRDCKAKVRVCEMWMNTFDYCEVGFEKHVDLWLSPSVGHRDMVMRTKHLVKHGVYYSADPGNWRVLPLGCDPDRYPETSKVPGRVVYCSSPDRGLHLLLQEWPSIKRAVPHASLRIFYRLRPWLDELIRTVSDQPDIIALNSRAVYIDECLRRMSRPQYGITVCDSVSRDQIEAEMCAAEVMAYPVDTIRWSEGFSCTILEGCAARACPIILDCDAVGDIYREACMVHPTGDVSSWRDSVIAALSDHAVRAACNARARPFAESLSWRGHAERLLESVSSIPRPDDGVLS